MSDRTPELPEYTINAAVKANEKLGDVKDRRPGFWGLFQKKVHRLSTDKGTDILDTYEAAELSDTDMLTGVGSARAQEKFLAMDDSARREASTTHDRRGEKLAPPENGLLIYMDVDGLKDANLNGYEEGDKLLKHVANAAKTIARRPKDVIFRQGAGGGDEFAIFLPGDKSKDMATIIERFETALRDLSNGTVTASMIVGEYGRGSSARETLITLDKRLAAAKAERHKRGAHVETIYIK
ncbi:MAG: diguanylate cyclase [Candidatus Woesebacteria bacterium]|nr:MAG: diguanylate cyclase [Candidatus Woesebacteria bacterium]